MLLLFLPLNPPQARREFGAVFFMMLHTLAALSVSRTILLRAWAINIVMWTRHAIYRFNSSMIMLRRYALLG